jgi:FKBP-type peptidyl-prolyl cis-trans isomerase 2
VGKLLSDGSVFESTEGKSPLQFTLGEGQVRARAS